MSKLVEIYTDGACSGNPGNGGWAAVLIYKDVQRQLSGGVPDTTNNRMELLAAIKALEALKMPCSVKLYSDSAYLCNGFNKGWIYNWIKNGWKTSSKKNVENVELWQRLSELTKVHTVEWIKVAGHSDNELNNLCDKLARQAIAQSK